LVWPSQLRIEDPAKRDQRPEVVDIMVPVLEVPRGAFTMNKLQPVSAGHEGMGERPQGTRDGFCGMGNGGTGE
jgi:hypothetical protein